MTNPRYGAKHQKLRAEWKKRIDGGEVVHCAAEEHGHPCKYAPDTRIYPGSRWQLGHYDAHLDPDGSRPPAPEHGKCNSGGPGMWKQRALQPNDTYGWFDNAGSPT